MSNMTEAVCHETAVQMKNGNYSGMASPKVYKGKGKGKGNFRY